MYFSDEIFNRKLEKISNFFLEVLNECSQKLGLEEAMDDFMRHNPSFLKQSLKKLCKKTLNHVTSQNKILLLNNKENMDIFNSSLNKTSSNPFDFDLTRSFVKQFEINKEKQFQDLNWKVENYKIFMDEKTQRFYEMSYNKTLFDEKIKEKDECIIINDDYQSFKKYDHSESYQHLKKMHEEENKTLMKEIHFLKELLRKKDNELLIKENILNEKERNLMLEEEAINIKSLANSFKSREILTKSKKIGEKELLLIIQSKSHSNSHHQPSKSFSNNL